MNNLNETASSNKSISSSSNDEKNNVFEEDNKEKLQEILFKTEIPIVKTSPKDNFSKITFNSIKQEIDETKLDISEDAEDTAVVTINIQRNADKDEICAHLEAHFNPRRMLSFECKTCGQEIGKKRFLEAHVRFHKGPGIFACLICKFDFARRSSFTNHMKTHMEQTSLPCPSCTKSFTRKENLKRHVMVHLKKDPFNCIVCNKSFDHMQYLEKHSKVHSMTSRPFYRKFCSDCNVKE